MQPQSAQALKTAASALINESELIGIAALVMKAMPLPGQPPISPQKMVLYDLAKKYRALAAAITEILPPEE